MWGQRSPGQSGRNFVWPPLFWGVVTKTGEEQPDYTRFMVVFILCVLKKHPGNMLLGFRSDNNICYLSLFQFVLNSWKVSLFGWEQSCGHLNILTLHLDEYIMQYPCPPYKSSIYTYSCYGMVSFHGIIWLRHKMVHFHTLDFK